MNKEANAIRFDAFINYVLKILAPMIVLIGLCGSAYYEVYIEPRIEERLKPLTLFVLETNLLLRKMAPDSIKKEVRNELRAYEQYLGASYKNLP